MVHFDIKTPGRDGNSEVKLYTKKDYLAKQDQKKNPKANEMNSFALQVIEALGGKENIKNVDACITKLRVQVVDRSKANKEQLMKLGARGVVYPSAQSVYAVFGTQADRIKNEIKEVLNA
ncbi:MAG: glucose PTS transporter subunit EIIB [Mycoplasmoidaceae bacterium]|nr:glucose PTS transporter subunit EIIB [Mycoplasmoidaceae bacterium]